MSEIRRLVGEDVYQDVFVKKEMDLTTYDIETVKKKPSDKEEEETLKKVITKCTCDGCGKIFSTRSNACRHKRNCSGRIPILKLEWNGSAWIKSSNRFYYRLQLGRNLVNLLEKGAIKEDALNSSQREYITMYKSLFSE